MVIIIIMMIIVIILIIILIIIMIIILTIEHAMMVGRLKSSCCKMHEDAILDMKC